MWFIQQQVDLSKKDYLSYEQYSQYIPRGEASKAMGIVAKSQVELCMLS